MFEEPEIIRLNIRHYETLLTLRSYEAERPRIRALLTEARTQLALAEAHAVNRSTLARRASRAGTVLYALSPHSGTTG